MPLLHRGAHPPPPLDPAADSQASVAWFNDPQVTRFMTRYRPLTLPEQEELLRSASGSEADLVLAIVERSAGRLIGMAGLHKIDWRNRHAMLAITIGEKDCRNKGHGSEAVRLLVGDAFSVLNLNRVGLLVCEHNERARHVYEKLGFRMEGQLRQEVFRDGRYRDTFATAVRRDEW